MAGLMQDDLTAITVAHLSNYLPAVLPEFKEHFKQIVVSILDLELASKE